MTRDVRGPFNLAATPIIEGSNLAEALGAKLVDVPASLVRPTLASAWHLRLAPPEPGLFDLVRQLPELDITRAHATLAWSPRTSALDAVIQFVRGMAQGTGGRTRPLEPDGMRARARELFTGVGSRV